MSGYLQRLSMRASAPAAGALLRPFVHSRSPIAALDQRLGLPGFEGVAVAGLPGGEQRGGRPVGHPVAGAAAPARSARHPRPPAGNRGDRGEMTPSPPTARSRASEPAAGQTISTKSVKAGPAPEPVAGRGSPHAAETLPPRAPAPARQPAETAASSVPTVSGEPRAAQDSSPPAPGVGEPAGPSAHDARPAEHAAVDALRYLQPSPPPAIAAPAAAAVQPASAPPAASPRLEIGSIEVEVLPPAEAPAPTPTQPSGPVTANSVSLIGPLAARRRSSQRFAMRQR